MAAYPSDKGEGTPRVGTRLEREYRMGKAAPLGKKPTELATEDWNAPVSTVARDCFFVPETKPIDQLLRDMRRERQRMAVLRFETARLR